MLAVIEWFPLELIGDWLTLLSMRVMDCLQNPCLPPRISHICPCGEAQHSATAFPTVPACQVSCNARGGLDIGEIAQRLVSSENFKVPFLLQNGVSWALHEPIEVMLLGVEYGWL